MNVFRDLYISANAERMATAVAEMERILPSGWIRDKPAEDRLQAFPVPAKRIAYCFVCKNEKPRPAAILFLAQKDSNTFYVSNILPVERHQLEHAEYNSVLENFYETVFKPVAEKVELAHTVTGAEAELDRWMDEETAELLRAFSSGANKGTGASHPNDRKRWNAFVLSAHRKDCELDPSTLERWLVEAEDWSPEIAEHLALEYESGRVLLAYALVH